MFVLHTFDARGHGQQRVQVKNCIWMQLAWCILLRRAADLAVPKFCSGLLSKGKAAGFKH